MAKTIALSVPMHGPVPEWSVISIVGSVIEVMTEPMKFKLIANFRIDQPVDKARNWLVDGALKYDADYVFFIDSDMVLKKGTLNKLLEVDKDIVSALSFQKFGKCKPAAYMKKKDEEKYDQIELAEFGEVIEVDAVGMACTLIKSNVFKDLEKPWFRFIPIKGKLDYTGEDIYFCRCAREKGYKIYLHTGIVANHVGGFVGIPEYIIRKDISLLNKETGKKEIPLESD